MTLHSYVVDFHPRPYCTQHRLNLPASSTNAKLTREVPSCERVRRWVWVGVRTWWMLYHSLRSLREQQFCQLKSELGEHQPLPTAWCHQVQYVGIDDGQVNEVKKQLPPPLDCTVGKSIVQLQLIAGVHAHPPCSGCIPQLQGVSRCLPDHLLLLWTASS